MLNGATIKLEDGADIATANTAQRSGGAGALPAQGADARAAAQGEQCALCWHGKEAEASLGGMRMFLLPPIGKQKGVQAVLVHELCARFAPRTYSTEGFEPDAQHDLLMVPEEVRRARKMKCRQCNKKCAAMGCEVASCPQTYHLPCAMTQKGTRFDCDKFVVYCPVHANRCEGEADSKDMQRRRRLLQMRLAAQLLPPLLQPETGAAGGAAGGEPRTRPQSREGTTSQSNGAPAAAAANGSAAAAATTAKAAWEEDVRAPPARQPPQQQQPQAAERQPPQQQERQPPQQQQPQVAKRQRMDEAVAVAGLGTALAPASPRLVNGSTSLCGSAAMTPSQVRKQESPSRFPAKPAAAAAAPAQRAGGNLPAEGQLCTSVEASYGQPAAIPVHQSTSTPSSLPASNNQQQPGAIVGPPKRAKCDHGKEADPVPSASGPHMAQHAPFHAGVSQQAQREAQQAHQLQHVQQMQQQVQQHQHVQQVQQQAQQVQQHQQVRQVQEEQQQPQQQRQGQDEDGKQAEEQRKPEQEAREAAGEQGGQAVAAEEQQQRQHWLPDDVRQLVAEVFAHVKPEAVPAAEDYLWNEGVRCFSDLQYIDTQDFFHNVKPTKMLLNKFFLLQKLRDPNRGSED